MMGFVGLSHELHFDTSILIFVDLSPSTSPPYTPNSSHKKDSSYSFRKNISTMYSMIMEFSNHRVIEIMVFRPITVRTYSINGKTTYPSILTFPLKRIQCQWFCHIYGNSQLPKMIALSQSHTFFP